MKQAIRNLAEKEHSAAVWCQHSQHGCRVPFLHWSTRIRSPYFSWSAWEKLERGHVTISLDKRAKYCDRLRASRAHARSHTHRSSVTTIVSAPTVHFNVRKTKFTDSDYFRKQLEPVRNRACGKATFCKAIFLRITKWEGEQKKNIVNFRATSNN